MSYLDHTLGRMTGKTKKTHTLMRLFRLFGADKKPLIFSLNSNYLYISKSLKPFFRQTAEAVFIQAFVPKMLMETLHISVLHRASRRDIVPPIPCSLAHCSSTRLVNSGPGACLRRSARKRYLKIENWLWPFRLLTHRVIKEPTRRIRGSIGPRQCCIGRYLPPDVQGLRLARYPRVNS